MKNLLIASLVILGLSNCSNKVYSLQDKPKEYIEMGSYGGFAGLAETYYFFPNGQRFFETGFMSDSVKQVTAIETSELETYAKMVEELNAMNFSEIKSTPPGNMTYYIFHKTKKTNHKVVWKNMEEAPEVLQQFFQKSTQKLGSTH
jgi:hypothetical protein